MKKFSFKRLLSTAVIFAVFSISVLPSAFAFDGPTHQYTTEKGIDLAIAINDSSYLDFYNMDAQRKLYEFCTMPDTDETYGAYRWHFYNVATGCNYAGEPTSALTKFQDHYNEAITCYKNHNESKAFEELGRALHFLEDMNTPVHTNNQISGDAVLNFPLHITFEKHCVKVQSNYNANMSIKECEYYKNNSLKTIGINSAMLSSDNFYLLDKQIYSITKIAENSIINAQKAVCGTLYKFYNDIH